MNLIDGKKVSSDVYVRLEKNIQDLKHRNIIPGLATVLVGDDPASHVYVGQKIKKCEALGMKSIHRPLSGTATQAQIEDAVQSLNKDPQVHGMIVQLPLPKHIDTERVISLIDPLKDADGLHPYNQGLVGRLKSWDDIVNSGIPLPCTPAGVIELLLHEKVRLSGKHAVVVGRSTLVGKPVSQLLLSLDMTVTMAHSRTTDLMAVCQQADILVAAIGKPKFLGKESVKPGAVVIDVGINRTPQGLQGDVDFDAVKESVSKITPVPGGVGPMTVAMLLKNTVVAAAKLSQ